MNYLNIKFFTKFMMIYLISFSMITNSIASTNGLAIDTLELLAKVLKDNQYSINQSITYIKKTNPAKAKELESYLKGTALEKFKITKASVENGKLVLVIDGHEIIYTINDKGEMNVLVGEVNIKLNASMSLDEISKTVSSALKGKKEFSLFSFLIQSSYASNFKEFLPILVFFATVLAAIAGFCYDIISQSDKLKILTTFSETSKLACDRIKQATDQELNVGELNATVDKLTELNLEFCSPVKKTYSHIHGLTKEVEESYQEACREIPYTKSCFVERIKQIKQGSVNGTSGTPVKLEYKAHPGKFTPIPTPNLAK